MITQKYSENDIKQQNYKKPVIKIENIIEKGKNFIEKLNNNISVNQPECLYLNPFSGNLGHIDEDVNENMDTLDQIELLEYSRGDLNENEKIERKDSISDSEQTSYLHDMNINMKDYDNFILKIEDLKIISTKILSKLNPQNLIYIECKVPLFKIDEHNDKNGGSNMYYDTFKYIYYLNYNFRIFNKSEMQDNIFHLSHVSYHKLKLGEDNFGFLANSKIEIYLHRINTNSNNNNMENSDVIIGKGSIDFNRVFLSKDFFFIANVEILHFAENLKEFKSNEETKNGNDIKKVPLRKGVFGKQSYTVNNTNNRNSSPYANKEKLMPKKEKEKLIDFPSKIAELELSCQLYKSQFDSDKDLKSNYKQIEKFKTAEDDFSKYNKVDEQKKSEIQTKVNKESPIESAAEYDEIKIDYDGILVLYLKCTDLKPIINDKAVDIDIYRRNYLISHKVFPNKETSSSEIMWNSIKPDFNYQLQMPFSLNSKTIDMIDTGFLLIEVWNKGNYNDELLGITKLELAPILDSLRIAEDIISITPISKSLFPLIICDGFQPVYNYEVMGNISYLHVTLCLGTSTQINNYVKKNQAYSQGKIITEENAKNNFLNKNPSMNDINIAHRSEKLLDNNHVREENKQSHENRNNYNDEEINEINNLLNNNYNPSQSNNNTNEINDDVDVEEILERNRKDIEHINNSKFKNTGSSLNESKKYEGNPFLVTNRELKNDTMNMKQFTISKESNFYLNEKDKELTKFTYNDFYNSRRDKKEDSLIPDYNSLGAIENKDQANSNKQCIDNQTASLSIKSPTFNENKTEKIGYKFPSEDIDTEENQKPRTKNNIIQEISANVDSNEENLYHKKPITNSKSRSDSTTHAIKHSFEIILDKIYNLQVLAKVKNPYLRYKFLSDTEHIKTDTLIYTSYEKDTSVIELDMKSSHSILLKGLDKIKEYLHDFAIELLSTSNDTNEEIIFGRINLPREELLSLIANDNLSKMKPDNDGLNSGDHFKNKYISTVFIYGTSKIKREDCIIGKIKLEIKYKRINLMEEESGSLLMERQTVFNRKIPKNATLVVRLNYFKCEESFINYFDVQKELFYLLIDAFGENKKLRRLFLSKKSAAKVNSLNGIFDEEFYFEIVIDKEILEYFKNKHLIIYLIISTRLRNENLYENFSGDSDNVLEDEKIGIAKIKLSDVISNISCANKNYKITSIKSNSLLGSVNVDFKLENSNVIPRKKEIKKLENNLENLKIILNEKNSRKLDGRFFFVLNFKELLFDEGFSNKLRKFDKQNSKLYFLFKFGKSLKRISPVFNLNDNLTEIFTHPRIYSRFLDINEILELNISKKKPQDILTQLTENIFEMKLFIKTEEENEHIGSFIIDLSKLLETSSKINENIYHSDAINVYCYNFETKQEESIKLQTTLSLIKSDLNGTEFKEFYDKMKNILSKNCKLLNEIRDEDCSHSQLNEFKSLLVREYSKANNNFVDYFSYIDLHLLNLEDDHGRLLHTNIVNLWRLFSSNSAGIGIKFNKAICKVFKNRKLNMKNSKDSSVNRYNLTKEKLVEILKVSGTVSSQELEEIIDQYEEDMHQSNREYFAVYSKKDESCLDLFDFILDLKQIAACYDSDNKDNLYNSIVSDKQTVSYGCVSITVFSATNLTISHLLSQKPNTYYSFTWGDDKFSSEIVVNTAHPSWNKNIEVKIPISFELIQTKLNKEINFKFFSRNSANNNSLSNSSQSRLPNYPFNFNTLEPKDEFIGESSFNLSEIIKYNFLNKNGEYEGFFNIVNAEKIRGQMNLKFIIDQKLLSCSTNKLTIKTANNLTDTYLMSNNISKDNTWENKQNNDVYPFSSQGYRSDNFITNNHLAKQENNDIQELDYNDLWEKLHDNTETIKKLTNEIDKLGINKVNSKMESEKNIEANNYLNNPSFTTTIEKERRITEKYELDLDLDMAIDFDDEQVKENEKYILKNDVKENFNEREIINIHNEVRSNLDAENNLSEIRSIILDEDVLDKAYSFSGIQNNLENENNELEKKNQSMFESFKKKENPKRPPMPALNNLYKTADKNFLNKIQKILKNKDSKKLNYASSEDSN